MEDETPPSDRSAAALTHYPALFRYALSLTGDWFDAEDLAQTVYLVALTSDYPELPLPLLKTICRTRWLDELRKRARRRTVDIAPLAYHLSDNTDLDATVLAHERAALVRAVLAGLGERDATILVELYVERQPRTGVPPLSPAVKSRALRARQRFARAWQEVA